MTLLPPGVKVHLALGYVDMRKGIDGLAMLVQGLLRQDPFTGHLFVFRGRTRANLTLPAGATDRVPSQWLHNLFSADVAEMARN